jgi:hypothetical protein
MAELAGRVADGINTQAGHPRLADLVGVARRARLEAGGDPAALLVTVFAGMDRRWLVPDGTARARLAELAVDRLILFVGPPYLEDIAVAGRLLAAAG